MRKTIIHKSNSARVFIILLAFMIMLLFWVIREGSWPGIFIIGVFIFIFLRFLVRTPYMVILQGNTVREESFLFTKSFKAHQVKQIVITQRILGINGGIRLHNYIEIQARHDHVISFEYLYGKSPDVYEILQGWHNKHKTSHSAGFK
jgi:hypothetical protein